MTPEPAVPRPAATVLLLRDTPGERPLQVFLQRRVAGMAFAGGMTVFPGGGVDQADVPDPELWAGPLPEWWGERFAAEPVAAGRLVHAAVRETFEECGVLLAARSDGTTPDPMVLAEARADLVARRRTLPQVLVESGLVLRADLLDAWSRWITPEESPRRYDTAFFVAAVPHGQEADAHTTEAVEAAWWYPAEALDRWRAGEMELMAPTFRTLQEIAEFPDTASVMAAAAARTVRPVIPKVKREGDEVVVVLPGDEGFEVAAGHLRPGDLR
ncbi:NUDIX hydrolase [Pseudonocardia broussonetiae]|uniref:NUDIX hydrolase n=1 Tax=Pseudonocardia broussonetiae TaxID=2736640 RepID=A0A6M6JGP3_9PSEU|nr:NUDIX hydrolase [Pseudonocardia broussonetiae]QJY45882.1 NUDIX hydrolase [Pseudonocardia broussonetiae]